MKITNKFGLPETFVNIMHRPTYSKGSAHLSATELITAPRLVQLRKKHLDEIESDVVDNVWSIWGSAIHAVLEHGKAENHIVEERITTTLEGWSISGAIDLQIIHPNGSVTINDYKTVGAWSVMNEKIDWEYQLNIYAWLVEKVKKMPVKSLEIVAIIRDWSRRDAETREGYPEAPIKVIPITLWPFKQRQEFVRNKIKDHSNAMMAYEMGEGLPSCTPEEMWEKPTSYAVMKDGNKRATSVHATEAEAQEALKAIKGKAEIVTRPGERTRCETFCPVNRFCSQYQQYQQEKE
jgi:PD-(D/E)XK nuclease superfamily